MKRIAVFAALAIVIAIAAAGIGPVSAFVSPVEEPVYTYDPADQPPERPDLPEPTAAPDDPVPNTDVEPTATPEPAPAAESDLVEPSAPVSPIAHSESAGLELDLWIVRWLETE